MAPPLDYATAALRVQLLQAAEGGDLRLFKKTARELDGGTGRLREAVEGAIAANCGAGPLHVAAVHGRIPVCSYLVEDLHFNVDAVDDSGETPLSYAVVNGTVNAVRYLLDHGANPDKPAGDQTYSPLHIAAGQGTPLHIAAVFGLDDVLKILLNHHADCNKAVCIADTPLIVALRAHRQKCVKLLIKAGADLKGVGCAAPIIVAITEGLTECLKCLIKAGADPNVLDDIS